MLEAIKKRKKNIVIASSILVVMFFVAGVYQAPHSDAVDTTYGPLAHTHDGWRKHTCCKTVFDSQAAHIQGELNWFDANNNLPGFTIGGGALTVDGKYGTKSKNAVIDFQNWVKNNWGDASMIVDGIVGNQTWTHMEFQVLNSYSGPGRLPAGVGIRFPIYSACRKITNNAGLDIAAPLKTSAEWVAFKNSAITTNAATNCDPSGGSGGGGSSTSCTSKWGSCTSSANCCSGLTCFFDEVGQGLCR